MRVSWWYVPYLQLTVAMVHKKKTIITSYVRLIEQVITTGKTGAGSGPCWSLRRVHGCDTDARPGVLCVGREVANEWALRWESKGGGGWG